MRVLLLADVPNGWIVDRLADRMIENTPGVQFEKRYYCALTPAQRFEAAHYGFDLIHFLNWNCEETLTDVVHMGIPTLLSIRSHRYPPSVKELARQATAVHVVNQALAREFPGSIYIPDGIDDRFFRKPIIGFAGKPDAYKGFPLIERACRELGLEFKPATGEIPPEQMPEYYRSIDVLVCASEAEGFGTVVMEALAMGTRVISTSGVAVLEMFERSHSKTADVTMIIPPKNLVPCGRTVDSIKDALLHFCGTNLELYRWPRICAQFQALYERVAAKVTA